VKGEVDFGLQQKDAVYVPIYVVSEIQSKENRTKDAVADAQNVLAKRDQARLVASLGGEDKAKEAFALFKEKGLPMELLKPRGFYSEQEQFNKELKEAGDTMLRKDDPMLVRALSNYFEAQKVGKNPTYEMLGQGGNGYRKGSFQAVYNKEQKAWELVRYGSPLLNSDDPEDRYEERNWFAVKGMPNNRAMETKMKKIAIVLNTFVEDWRSVMLKPVASAGAGYAHW